MAHDKNMDFGYPHARKGGYAVENKKTGRRGFAFHSEQMEQFDRVGKILVRYVDHEEVLYAVKREKLKMIGFVD